jgi:hypothetical protein
MVGRRVARAQKRTWNMCTRGSCVTSRHSRELTLELGSYE